MDFWKNAPSVGTSVSKAPLNTLNTVVEKAKIEQKREVDIDVDLREVYFLIMHFLSSGPCQRTFGQFWNELLEHELLPRRYHAWFSRSGACSGNDNDDGASLPLSYNKLLERCPHIEKDHLVKLLRQLLLHTASPMDGKVGGKTPNAAHVPTLLGSGSFSLLDCNSSMHKQVKPLPVHLRWPHMQVDQVRGLSLREIGGGFAKHHRAPSIRSACYAIAKPSTMVQKMQNIKKLRGHRNAVYCAIFDRAGRYVITGSDDRLVKIWSMETAFCLASCRGHEGDITDLAVSSNNALVASASNDFVIRVWRLPDGLPISVLRGHTGAVTAIAFSPRPGSIYQLLSSSDDGTCRIWDARYSHCSPRIYVPKPSEPVAGKNNGQSCNGPSSSNVQQNNQILCCAYNANGTVFVTGSSDTFARVWSAFKSNTDEPEQPINEMDVLSGHENDVNYVQFSGCAVATRSSMFDTSKEENIPKFKNSWFCHDNIVTCSRDGSAIIWIPRSRRSHGKSMRWTRAYHLKVPPPPLPPQPTRGGPRQRILPTPRGVNMIVWSLDNRFVLAAIMDCRICVWNAVDGSLVHSLAGHSASSYVLDVHPFNPRIAMSAGYDGRTIVWDIWEGIPIRIYEIGRFKLVDGKFSPDGTSIVLSDDVGQIYLLNTGQGESQKDAKYDQFFLGDYRPLIQDAAGNVLDQETQLPPHRRNIQDPLCDSSMVPYPEPYQTLFQQRRLGALGVEWRPSSIKFAIGPDFSFGQDYQMLPLEDLDRMLEPQPEFIDAIFWEPDNEVISDDTDSEYNVAEECTSDGEQGSLYFSSPSDPDSSAEDSDVEHKQKDGLRRSRRRRHKMDVELMTSSGRRVKKRVLDENDVSNGAKKNKSGQKISKGKSFKKMSSRPQRAAARNAMNIFSRITGTSTEGDDDDDNSEEYASNSEWAMEDSNIRSSKSGLYMHNVQEKCTKELVCIEPGDIAKPPELPESESNLGSRKKLVLKISLRDSKKPISPNENRLNGETQADVMNPFSKHSPESRAEISSEDPGTSSAVVFSVPVTQNQNRNDIASREHPKKVEDHIQESAGDNGNKIKWGEVKIRTSKRSRLGDALPADASTGLGASFDAHKDNKNDINGDEEHFGTDALRYQDGARITEIVPSDKIHSTIGSSPLGDLKLECGASMASYRGPIDKGDDDWSGSDKLKNCDSIEVNEVAGTNHSQELKEIPSAKSTKIKIKTKGILQDLRSPSILGVPEKAEGSSRFTPLYEIHEREESRKVRAGSEGFDVVMEENASNAVDYHGSGIGFSDAASDAIRRTRSMKMKPSSREPNAVSHNFMVQMAQESLRTSRNASNQVPSEEIMSSSKMALRSRSSRNRQGGYNDNDVRFFIGKRANLPMRKLSWLMLSKHEDGYRYIPQLGDEVVYLRQGHQEYIDSTGAQEKGPWNSIKGCLSALETCKVQSLDYATVPGSGDCCCKLTLKFIDPSSGAFGKIFKLTLPELINFPDFVVEKTRYDAVISRNWTNRDKCLVWWRNESGEGGDWWEGRILSSQAKSDAFPDSPWERYFVRYKTDPPECHRHSPWELHDPDILWEHPHIDFGIRDKLLSSFDKLEQSDHYGIQKLNEASLKLDFFNRFPVPLYPEVIRSRLENNYYRSWEAVEHDILVMMENAESYFVKNAELSNKMRRLSDWFTRKLSKF